MKLFLNKRLNIDEDMTCIQTVIDQDLLQSFCEQSTFIEFWYTQEKIIIVARNDKKKRIYREEFSITEQQKEFFSLNDIPIEINITEVDKEN